MKDNRKVYKYQAIEVNGTIVNFDGKGNKDNKTLKIYRYYGDIALQAEAIQNFAIDHDYDTVIIL